MTTKKGKNTTAKSGRLCGECGEDISPARLEGVPNAAYCKECQSMIEQLGNSVPGKKRSYQSKEHATTGIPDFAGNRRW